MLCPWLPPVAFHPAASKSLPRTTRASACRFQVHTDPSDRTLPTASSSPHSVSLGVEYQNPNNCDWLMYKGIIPTYLDEAARLVLEHSQTHPLPKPCALQGPPVVLLLQYFICSSALLKLRSMALSHMH